MSCLDIILTYRGNVKYEKKIRARQDAILENDDFDESIKQEYSDVVKQNSLKKLKCLFKETMVAKEKLEAKAKSMTLAITVSVTLILGLSDTISKIFEMINIFFIRFLIALIGIMAIGYMIISGLSSAKIFLTNIMIYKVNEAEDDLRQQYKKCIILNRLSNNVRSNYIFTSYECLRNSLVLLFFIFTFLVIIA